MRRSRAALLGLLALAATGCRDAPSDPVQDLIRARAEPGARAALAEMFGAYGGYEALRRLHNVEYIYRLDLFDDRGNPQVVTRQVHRLGLGATAQVYVEDLGVEAPEIVRLDGTEVEVTRGGAPVPDRPRLAFSRAYSGIVLWSFRSPWSLLDPGSRLLSRGVRTPEAGGAVPVGPCDVVRLRFDEPAAAGGTDDWHDFYISRRSRLVERVHSYRAADNAFRVSIWSDHRTHSGVRVASRRETHASDGSGAIGRLEAVAEYSDIRFDAPFGDDVFHAGAAAGSAAPPGSPVGQR